MRCFARLCGAISGTSPVPHPYSFLGMATAIVKHQLSRGQSDRALRSAWRGQGGDGRQLVVGASPQHSARTALLDAAPLLEEEGDPPCTTIVPDGKDPRFVHGSGAWSTLAADDHPVDAVQGERAEVFEEWLDREKANSRPRIAEHVQAGEAVGAIFDADAEPYVPARLRPR